MSFGFLVCKAADPTGRGGGGRGLPTLNETIIPCPDLERGRNPAGIGPLLYPEYLDGPSTEGAAWSNVVCAASV